MNELVKVRSHRCDFLHFEAKVAGTKWSDDYWLPITTVHAHAVFSNSPQNIVTALLIVN